VYTTVSVALLTYVAALAIFSRDDERSRFPNFGEALW
jgi:hypothetical protein